MAHVEIEAIEPENHRPCKRCAFWGDGINDPTDASRWWVCRQDGKGYRAHRDYGCGAHQVALTLRQALRRSEKASCGLALEDGGRADAH